MNEELYRKEVLELVENLRTLKRQLRLLRAVRLPEEEQLKLYKALSVAEEEIRIFRS